MNEDTKVRVFLVGIIALIIGGLFYGGNEKTRVKKRTSDIVYETDLGEKFIVKNAAVSIDAEPMFSFINSNSGETSKSLAKMIRERIEKTGISTEKDIDDINSYESRAKRRKAFYEKNIKPIVDEYDDGLIVSYDITYKPIFQDLNDFKRVMNTKSVTCFNPLFKDNSLITGYKILPKLDLLDEKVCSKYANFKIDWYDLPDEDKY